MELSLQARKERLLKILNPEATFLDESAIDPHSDPDDTPHLITLHDVHELLQQRQAVEKREQRAAGRSRNPEFFTPPSTSDLDTVMADKLVKQEYPEFEDMRPGDMSDPDVTFVLWDNVQQYPQHYIGKANATKSAMEFEKKLSVVSISKAGKKKQKSQKRQREAKERQLDSLQHVQRCLGIRGVDKGLIGPDGKVLRLDIWNAMPYKRHSDVVFVAIDIEVAEQSPSTILEIGISIMDTLEVVRIPPGENASNWFRLIKSRHLLTYETRFTRNHKFVHGCPDAYDFGESELVKRARLRARVLEILTEYSQLRADDPAVQGQWRFRPIILVGHDIASDISYLNSIDLDIGDIPGFSRTADTKDMHQIWRESSIGRSLGNILDDLLIPHTHLHNAGNDAAYTLQAMLALALRAQLTELHKKQDLEHALNEESHSGPAHVDAKAASLMPCAESSQEWASHYHAGNECW